MTRLSSQGKRFALVTVIQGEAALKYIISDGRVIYGGTDPVVLELGEKALAQSKVIEVELRDGKAVAEPVEPRPSVVVVGKKLIAKVTARLAKSLGYSVASIGVTDVEADFVSTNLNVLGQLVDQGTAVIIANEGGSPDDSEAALMALKKGARYVGVLASQKRAALIMADLLKRGVTDEEMKGRFFSPIGLDIGSRTAEEIALSILAEVLKVLRGGTGKPYSEVKDPRPLLADAINGKLEDACAFKPVSLSSDNFA